MTTPKLGRSRKARAILSSKYARQHLPAIAARAFVEDMRDFSDAEIERVYGRCVLPTFCIEVVTAYRDNGGKLEDFLLEAKR